jgi:hypothetical protein
LVGVTLVVENERMQIAVAGVKHVGNAGVFLAAGAWMNASSPGV